MIQIQSIGWEPPHLPVFLSSGEVSVQQALSKSDQLKSPRLSFLSCFCKNLYIWGFEASSRQQGDELNWCQQIEADLWGCLRVIDNAEDT